MSTDTAIVPGISRRAAQTIAREIGTPAVAVDLDRVERNIARIQAACDAAGLANRPHIKTHKSPFFAKMQLAAGAHGITCQKLGEAEIMVAAGIDDILITYNVMGEATLERLSALLRRGPKLTLAVDSVHTIDGLAMAARQAGRVLDVVIECDTGRERAGVATIAEAVALADHISRASTLRFAGFMLYPPETKWAETQLFFDEALAGVRALGLDAGMVSTGGTPNLINLGKLRGASEHRAGTYIFNDRMMMGCGAAVAGDVALTVVSRVVSRGGADRGILDAGSKTLTADPGGGLEGYGHIIEHPQAQIARFAEEHGFLDLSRCNDRPDVGDVVRIVPNHVCVVVNMVDELIAVRGDEIVATIPVAARGRLR
ncbi:MAG: D-TA family PLP-dependent enzyme [Hyphomicrobiales bacterium]|nr:D-TA family PLP-dependent enzyme [Hyphomicrobiales bacterium]OQW80685.1 MAG: alanine racemase [Proteobacteria bacterium ST_bin15]